MSDLHEGFRWETLLRSVTSLYLWARLLAGASPLAHTFSRSDNFQRLRGRGVRQAWLRHRGLIGE